MTKTGWNRVKNTRVVVSLVTFSIITTLFLDAWHLLPASIHRYLTAIEIIPVLMQVLLSPGTVAVAGFVSVILLTLLFGRIYCSTLCPLGVLQDMIIRLSKKVNKRKRFAFYKPMYWLQYAVFGLGILAALGGGSMIVGDLLEPFSNYGRLISVTLLPAVVAANNGTAALLGRFAIYSLPNIPYHFAGIWLLLSSVIFFAILLFLSVTEGRLFCNGFCPAGALLSLISRFSIFTLKINEDNCNECGACDRICIPDRKLRTRCNCLR